MRSVPQESDGGYRDLIVWQKSMSLVRMIYAVSKNWPTHEQFGLTNQIRRAAIAIPSNRAEGKGRTGIREFRHHVSIAHGSLCELETQLLIARDLNYLPKDQSAFAPEQSAEVGRMLRGLLKSLS
jgi:four helix bundle protein